MSAAPEPPPPDANLRWLLSLWYPKRRPLPPVVYDRVHVYMNGKPLSLLDWVSKEDLAEARRLGEELDL